MSFIQDTFACDFILCVDYYYQIFKFYFKTITRLMVKMCPCIKKIKKLFESPQRPSGPIYICNLLAQSNETHDAHGIHNIKFIFYFFTHTEHSKNIYQTRHSKFKHISHLENIGDIAFSKHCKMCKKPKSLIMWARFLTTKLLPHNININSGAKSKWQI